jgi:hypothetical protein
MTDKLHNNISEATKVKVKLSTAWGVITSVVVTAVWLTVLLMKVQNENQFEHSKLMLGLAELNLRSSNWITKSQLEESLMYLAVECHDTNMMNRWREIEIRNEIRKRINQ